MVDACAGQAERSILKSLVPFYEVPEGFSDILNVIKCSALAPTRNDKV